MEAEVLRDSLIAISGRMNLNMYGSPVPVTVDEVGQFVVGVDSRDSAGRPTGVKTDLAAEAMRRSIYIQVRRSMPLAMLETFDGPDMNPNCNQRNSSTVSPQSLLLMNNEAVLSSAERFAQHLQDQAGDNLAAQVQLAWELAFGVPPTESQTQVALLFLAQQTADFPVADQATPSPAWRALATYCQALVSSNRFLYID